MNHWPFLYCQYTVKIPTCTQKSLESNEQIALTFGCCVPASQRPNPIFYWPHDLSSSVTIRTNFTILENHPYFAFILRDEINIAASSGYYWCFRFDDLSQRKGKNITRSSRFWDMRLLKSQILLFYFNYNWWQSIQKCLICMRCIFSRQGGMT